MGVSGVGMCVCEYEQGAHTYKSDHSPNREMEAGTPGPQAQPWEGGTAASGRLGQEESTRKGFWVACLLRGVRENGLSLPALVKD